MKLRLIIKLECATSTSTKLLMIESASIRVEGGELAMG